MYPDSKSPSFGIFVKNFVDAISQEEITFTESSLIVGRKSGISKLWAYVLFLAEIIVKSNFGNYDVIYVHYIQHSLIPLNFWLRRKGKKLVLNSHGTDVLGSGRLADRMRKINSKLIRSADLVIVPSQFFVSKVRSLGVCLDKIFVSPSGGFNPEIFFPAPNKNLTRYRLGYFGRLDTGKGVETLLRAFDELHMIHDFHLEIIGSGELEKQLKAVCLKMKIAKQVDFAGGLTQAQSAERIRNWDVLIFPSELEESLGLVGLEAMACGVPVIGSTSGGITTYLDNGKNGFTFTPGDATDLKEKILSFYGLKEEERILLSENAIQTSKKYQSKEVSKNLITKLKSLS